MQIGLRRNQERIMEGTPLRNEMSSQPAGKRNKFIWRAFLILNFAIGAYMFLQPGKKQKVKVKSDVPAEVASTPAPVTAPIEEEALVAPSFKAPVIAREPLPDDLQREVFQWMLEEKRKVRPRNQQEKHRIDEEKAILKEFIRSNSIPKI